MALALDTNCLLRWLVRDVPEQTAIVDAILESERVHVADMAIAETVYVMKKYYGISDGVVAGAIAKIITHDKITCNRILFGKVLDDINTSPKVSFVDICLAQYAGLGDLKLLTFDKTLTKKFPRLTKLAS